MTRQFLAVLALVASATATYHVNSFKAGEVATTEVLPKAQFSLPLTQKAPRASYKKNMLSHLNKKKSGSAFLSILEGSDDDEEYLTDITIGGQKFTVIVDTGSSDTWLAAEGFKCFNLTSYPEPQSECAFGTSGFSKNESSTFKTVPDKNFNISYGDGEFLTGTVGTDTVTLGLMTVTKQEIGLVTDAAWEGDGVNSGLMGLAFPGLTSVYSGTNPDNDSATNSDPYNPLFFTAVAEGVVAEPYFSVALDRGSVKKETNSSTDKNLGYLAFGGLVDVPVTDTAVTVPIQGYAVSSTNDTTAYYFYTVEIDGYNFEGAPKVKGAGKQAILDTGTTLVYLPTSIAKAYNEAIVPPGKNSEEFGGYILDCNATAPPLSVTIGGKNFTIDGKDVVAPGGFKIDGKEACFSGIQDGGSESDADNIFILGDVFLHNVVATFNVKTPSVTLTQREAY